MGFPTSDLFGNKLVNEESFEILYKGPTFSEGKILISLLQLELKGVEYILTDTINLFIRSGKLPPELREFEIYVEVEKGSIFEKIKVVFKNQTAIAVIGTFLIPFLNTTYDHFLNRDEVDSNNKFYKEIKEIESNKNYRESLKNLIYPLSSEGDQFLINDGIININFLQKKEIIQNLDQEIENDTLKNGEFEEELSGTIRKLDLDAAHYNYLGFNIDGGPSKIPTSIRGEFNLNDYKAIIDERISITSVVRYKDGEIKHIEILEYKVLRKQNALDLGSAD